MLQNLKLLREKNGITQERLGDAIGVSQQSINKYENHNIEPDISTLIAMADYFHTSVDFLIGHTALPEDGQLETKLSREELDVINAYRILTRKEKESIRLILDNYNQK